jgi:hypothetical protein
MKRLQWIERRSRGVSPSLDSIHESKRVNPSNLEGRFVAKDIALSSLQGVVPGAGAEGSQSARSRGSKVQLPSIHGGRRGTQIGTAQTARSAADGSTQMPRSGRSAAPATTSSSPSSYCPSHLRDIIHQLPPTVVQALATLRGETALPLLSAGPSSYGGTLTTAPTAPAPEAAGGVQAGLGFGMESAIGTQIGVQPHSGSYPQAESSPLHCNGPKYEVGTRTGGEGGRDGRVGGGGKTSSNSSHQKAFHEEVMNWNADDLYHVEHFQ